MKRSDFLKSIATIIVAPSIIKDLSGVNVPVDKAIVPIGQLKVGSCVTVNKIPCRVCMVFLDTFVAFPILMSEDAGNGAGNCIEFKLKDL